MIWNLIAKLVARKKVADYLIARAQKTPYIHLTGYMERWWLFNPTPPMNDGKGRRFEWLPSIRIHHILREDLDRHLHNHPWNARTIILRGYYDEEREDGRYYLRRVGTTAKIGAHDFHRIISVSNGGVWTMFISWRWVHGWGFKTENGFVDRRTYLDQ